jgi:hypothetical protein
MRTHLHKTVPLGNLIAAAFDEAERVSPDPREVSRLAAWIMARMLRRARPTPGLHGGPPCPSPIACC